MIWYIVFWSVTVGLLALTLGFAWFIFDEMAETTIGGIIGAAIVLAICLPLEYLLAYAIYDEAFVYHETFALRTDRWGCTASHMETTTTMVMSGKVMVPVTTTSEVCDQYSRK